MTVGECNPEKLTKIKKSLDSFKNIRYIIDILYVKGVALKTEVIMERELLGLTVRQRHKTGFFNLIDLECLGNKYRLDQGLGIKTVHDYLRSPVSKEFMAALEKEVGTIQVGGRGRGKQKWVHPFLFIDIALWYSPELKVKVYQWMYDNLLVFRDNGGESFKNMVKALCQNFDVSSKMPVIIPKVARQIYSIVGVSGKNKWENATEKQLHLRDNLQIAIHAASYNAKSIDEAVGIAKRIIKAEVVS